MLKVKGLEANYAGIKALNGIDLEINAGEIIALIGANGAGKSTTLKSIVGLVKNRRGEISFKGQNISKIMPFEALDKGIALVPEGRWIFPNLTVEENLKIGGFRKSKQDIARLSKEQFALFPILEERRSQKAGTLSGGEQQMLAFARALMAEPTLLLLDEPSLGLAPLMVANVFDFIKKVNASGITILVVEQNSAMALSVATRGYVLESGRIVFSGDAGELLNDKKVQSAYLGFDIEDAV